MRRNGEEVKKKTLDSRWLKCKGFSRQCPQSSAEA